ncbi:hypothetical protein ED312_09285 [Sinomicrobium pectinilyticum]|uniref:Uncharacterized protein n=1 Tax=Sinomicrobium pectinilyticum TaxID=1084421 RepID=A0A3N0EJU9_SINP1|nr:hypothetical protein [Sinomicrobium pectinilyticum]RNL88101.1 hypothetical protein ED312_09285 [Sinomicrobium pectinilyticum]
MKFTKLEDIINEFDLESSEISEIKKELQKLLKIVHSGKNSDGQFSNKAYKLMYPKIMSALEFVKSETLPTNRAELAEVIKEIIPHKPNKKKIAKLDEQLKTEIKSLKRASLVPKISASAVTIVLSFIWFFPSKAIEHPILGNIIKPTDWVFTTIWVTSILITGFVWIISRRKEKMIEYGTKRLNIESVQNNLLNKFLRSKEYSAERKNEDFITFTKDDIVEYFTDLDIGKLERVYYFNKKIKDRIKKFINKVFGFEENIDIEIAQSLADILTERLIAKKLVTEIPQVNLSTTYRKEFKREKKDDDMPF